MNIKAEINARVEVLVADLTELVRKVAIEGVRRSLAAEGGHAQGQGPGRAQRPAAQRKRTKEPAATRRGGPARAEAAAGLRAKAGVTPPAPKRQAAAKVQPWSPVPRRIEPPPPPKAPPSKFQPAKAPPAKAPPATPAPRITVIPPVRARVKRAKPAPAPKAPTTEPAAAPAEARPARSWVVVRRPARDRREPGSGETGTGTPDPNRLP